MKCSNCNYKNVEVEKVYDKELKKIKIKCQECGSVLGMEKKPKHITEKIDSYLNESFKNFTFKKEAKLTGLASVGSPNQSINIKLNKIEVGMIAAPNWQSKNHIWKVRFRIIKDNIKEDGNTNCIWKWITFTKDFTSGEEAQEWVKTNSELIQKKYKIVTED